MATVPWRVLSWTAIAIPTLGAACSSSSADPPAAPAPDDTPVVDDTDAQADAAKPPPPPKKDAGIDAAPPPQIYPTVNSRGGKVIKTPKIVPITFNGDGFQTNIDDFVPRLGPSTYWKIVSAEYGIGAVSNLAPIHLAETPISLDDSQVKAWLQNKFDTDARFGVPDGDTLYAIFYPQGVTVTLQGIPSCQGFGGYHNETSAKGTPISYSVIPHCGGGFAQYDLDLITSAQSHEMLEWASDPFPYSGPAYAKMDDAHWIWSSVMYGELGDMCFTGGNDISLRPAELGGYLVQRTWSNQASLAGHDPCVPYVQGSAPYFTAIPDLPNTYDLVDQIELRLVTTPALQVPVGQSRAINVNLYSDGPTGADFTVRVVDIAQIVPGGPAYQTPSGPAEFTYALDKDHGQNGDVLQLTVTSVAPAKKGFGFVLISTLGANVHVWPGMVFN